MPPDKLMLQCYNRGCCQKFDPENNKDDSCRHHPGEPFFHDAYKGWSCCNKKCTDFTEFLNIRGCTLAKHSNVKPPEPEKPVAREVPDQEVIEIKPIVPHSLPRPSFDSPMTVMKPEITASLKQQLNTIEQVSNESKQVDGEITIGTSCKNNACNASYEGPESNEKTCTFHPGIPIFHEGMKYWSCCQRKTSDFNAFLSQAGCETGSHAWRKENDSDKSKVQCRWDYHQTGSLVVVTIYAKQYSPSQSVIKLNPIRLFASLVFPQQSNSTFDLDMELKGIVNIDASHVTMYGTKVEIELKKAEAGSWPRLEIPRPVVQAQKTSTPIPEKLTPQLQAVDLNDL